MVNKWFSFYLMKVRWQIQRGWVVWGLTVFCYLNNKYLLSDRIACYLSRMLKPCFTSSFPDWSLSYRPRDCKAKSGSITRVPNPRIFQKECRITHRIRKINDLLTLACGLGFGPLSIRLASPSEVSNKFVLRVTFKNYNALIGKCVSVPDAIGRRARITAANDCK